MKHKTHVLIPFTTTVACGSPHYSVAAGYREQVTCKICRRSDDFKKLPKLPKRQRAKDQP